MAAWPGTLPNPSASGYGLDPVDQTARTDMEMGAARARRRTAARNDKVRAQWTFTDAQMAIFRTWFDNAAEADGGAAWFDVSLPIGTTGLTAEICRFVGPWQATALTGDYWQVSATLEVR